MNKELKLVDLVNVETLQKIQDAFSNMTGIAALTTDSEGVPITDGSNISDFCFEYTRKTPLGCSRCEKCDKYGAEIALKEGKSITYFCHAGLMDFAAPIMVDGKMIGSFIGGQVLTALPDEEQVRAIAEELGIDQEEYVQASKEVNIVPKETIDKAAEFLYVVANIISDIAYGRYMAYRAGEELERATNMKSDFLANMSHEIRTPMNAVIGMAEMALREDLSDNAREYINEIKTSAKSLLTIINDILDFSKIESGKMDIVPVEYELMSIINDVTNIVVTRLEDKDVELIVDVDPNIPRKLFGDNDRIKQIILNLTNNAIKFTRQGQVIIRFGYSKLSDNEIMLKCSVEDTGIGIKKEDLSKLFQSFQQLDSKRNRNIEGTGLGLAICKQLLTIMNGDISVESEYEKGSCFSFTLPQKVLDGEASISIKSEYPIMAAGFISNKYIKNHLEHSVLKLGAEYIDVHDEADLDSIKLKKVKYLFVEDSCFSEEVEWFVETNPQITIALVTDSNFIITHSFSNMRILKKPIYALNIAAIFNDESIRYGSNDQREDVFDFIAPEAKVLIVDDNAINLTVAQGLIEPLKMQVDTALSGKEAIDKITHNRYDIVFMDHMMPELDGVETTHIIRRLHPEYTSVPIIALTANAIHNTMEMFLKEGMNDFVAKPIEIHILVSKVKEWLPAEKIQKNLIWEEKAKQEKNKLPKIGDLDVKTALNLLGSEKLYWNVLRDYYRVIEQKVSTIKSYEKAENCPAYTIEVHALKSASKQIGAHDLSEKAAELEAAGNAGNIELIHKKTDEMLLQYRSYIDVLAPYFAISKQDDSDKQTITKEIRDILFEKLRCAMDDLDMDAMEGVLEEMKQYRYEEQAKELFEQLQEAVNNIDIDSLEELLKKWEDFD